MKKTKDKKGNKGTVKRVLKYLAAYKWLFLLSLILAAVVVGLTIYIPVLIGQAIDLAVGEGNVDIDGIFKILIKIGIISAATALFQWIMNICNNKIFFLFRRAF